MIPIDSSTPLSQELQRVILHHPHLHHRSVHFSTQTPGKVTMAGKVGSFFEKQMAQEAIRQVAGVSEVENLLEVQWAQAGRE